MSGWNRTSQTPTKSAARVARVMIAALGCLIVGAAVGGLSHADAQEANWIWSPEHKKEEVPSGAAVHFRKSFTVRDVEQASITIAADDTYELFLNGRRVGKGESTRRMMEYDLSKLLTRGTNQIAIKVTNTAGATAALAARVSVKQRSGDWGMYSSDASWKTSTTALPLWNTTLYNDRSWEPAQVFGRLGETAPWDRREDVPMAEVHRSERFSIAADFEVQKVLEGDEVGSLIAMTFNEFGHILLSREGGPLLLAHDTNGDNTPDAVRTYCDQVKSCQGILALNGSVYVTAEGPDGIGLYRLRDNDRDGTLEDVHSLIKFECSVVEHGPHGIVLGPDGLIYVLLGNHTKVLGEIDPGSPHRDYYDTDLSQPKFEDPGGHAVGIKAPGGMIIRTDTEGAAVQVVAGGLRNPYDICFNRDGELLFHDADMESDDGMTWYRPTRLCHVIPGGEYGWRSGWSKWPDYYPDTLPPLLETGRGSPTGIVAYNHHAFPSRFHGAIFTADWSQGRIMAVKLKRNGASYTASGEVFLEGNPLNVTDLEVGPDGCLYFTTGGRGTSGGIYRVKWKGTVPAEVSNIGTGLAAVVRQPQLQSSFARQNVAALKKQMGEQWAPSLLGVARSASNPAAYRLQALELMQLYGPEPTPELLIALTREQNEAVRAQAAELMGLHPSDEVTARLVELLGDSDRNVRRKACEALSRSDKAPPFEDLAPLLISDDRFEAWAARRLLERMDVDQWRRAVLDTKDHRLLVQGGLALMTAYPDKRNGLDLLEKISAELKDYTTDREFIDLLRVSEVAMVRGNIQADEVPGFRRQLADEFPAGDPLMNRGLVRLLVYMQDSSINGRYLEYLRSDVPNAEKLFVAMHLRYLNGGWSSAQRMELIEFYEAAQKREGGGSYARYIINATRDFVKAFNEEEASLVLAKGAKLPNAALGALYRLPEKLTDDQLVTLEQLDAQLDDNDNESFQRLKVGIVAVMARSGDERSLSYMRKVWQLDPERRQPIALGLSQWPEGENWPLLIQTLPNLEINAAREILTKLATVPQAPEEAAPYRYVILLGLKMKEKGSEPAIDLLEFWTGETLAENEPVEKQMEAWQKWFAEKHPNEPEAKLPKAAETAKYTFEELKTFLASDDADDSSRQQGAAVFAKAQCAKCHKHGELGESNGPDLTSVTSRFTRKELLESIMYPSHVISSQYASKAIRTSDGKVLVGMVTQGAAGETVVLTSQGERITLQAADIEEMKPSKTSAMPEGLLDALTMDEIADLFALLEAKKPQNIAKRPTVREAIR